MDLPQETSVTLFNGRHFNCEIIVLCVRWYVSYKLSYRDLVAIMAERNIDVTHTTILRWVQRYCRSLRSGGSAMLDRWAPRGASMKPTSRSKGNGATSIGQLTQLGRL
jgi:hypothetical protein